MFLLRYLPFCLLVGFVRCEDEVPSLIRRVLTDEDYPGAVCNDGTPAVYHHTPLANVHPTKFFIYLNGGYFCRTKEACHRRCFNPTKYYVIDPGFCTSNQTTEKKMEDGIFNQDPNLNPYFNQFFRISVHYCSSDMYLGDREASPETGGLYFKGRAIFTAVINALKKDVGLGAEGDLVVLAGSSAGGRGALFNCDYIEKLLPGVDIRCAVDAAVFFPPFSPTTFRDNCTPFIDILREANTFHHGHMPDDFDPTNWWKAFPMPLFLSSQVFDVYFMYFHCADILNESHVEVWAQGMQKLSNTLVASRPTVGLFHVGCHQHSLFTTRFWFLEQKAGQENLAFAEVFANWIEGRGQIQVYDECAESGVACRETCPLSQEKRDGWIWLVYYD